VSNPEVIKIDPDGRYIFLVRYPDGIDEATIHMGIDLASAKVERWWESPKKFLFIPLAGGVDVRVEKVGNDVKEAAFEEEQDPQDTTESQIHSSTAGQLYSEAYR
jgi:hypothetical protein